MRKLPLAVALLSIGALFGLLAGVFIGGWLYEVIVVRKNAEAATMSDLVARKDAEVMMISDVSEPYVILKTLNDGKRDLAMKVLEQRLEVGLLGISCCDMKTLSKDDLSLLSKVKSYLRDHPIKYITPESGAKIETMLKSIPDGNAIKQ